MIMQDEHGIKYYQFEVEIQRAGSERFVSQQKQI